MREKKQIPLMAMLTGIFGGFVCIVAVATITITSVVATGDFWIAQNNRYGRSEELGLLSNDDYNALFHSYMAMLKGKTDPKETDITVTLKGTAEDYGDTFVGMQGMAVTGEKTAYSQSVKMSEKQVATIEHLDNDKYGRYDKTLYEKLSGKMCFSITLQYIVKNFEGVNFSDITVTDKDGNAVKTRYEQAFVMQSGALRKEEITGNRINFKPASSSTAFRIYVDEAVDPSELTLSFNAESAKNTALLISYTYEDKLSAEQVSEITGAEERITTENERQELIRAGKFNLIMKIASGVLFVGFLVLVFFTADRHGRDCFWGIGINLIVTAVALCIIVNALVYAVPSTWGFEQMFTLTEGTTMSVMFDEAFAEDFAKGSLRFFDFLMLAPLGLGYIFLKIANGKNKDPNEDYLYQ